MVNIALARELISIEIGTDESILTTHRPAVIQSRFLMPSETLLAVVGRTKKTAPL